MVRSPMLGFGCQFVDETDCVCDRFEGIVGEIIKSITLFVSLLSWTQGWDDGKNRSWAKNE
jgi:hypothetical protein